ncbi:MAG: hypothetical protein VX153_05390 [Verrucomicrobiota bacterium]|nr:hypothetical protein [Verrucomicrobiota bacterium]
MKLKILIFSLLPFILNANSFLALKVSDLSFKKEEKPGVLIDNTTPYALKYSRDLRTYIPSNLPYFRTEDAAEAFISFDKQGGSRTSFSTADIVLCFRDPKPKIEGQLFLYQKPNGWIPFSFTFEKKNNKNLLTEQKSEEAFLRYRAIRYKWLQELGVPGTAWFRHQVTKDNIRLAQIRKEPKPSTHTHNRRAIIRPTRNTELENSMDLFSGGRAISENLQLNRELRLSSDEQNRTIPVSSVAGITIDEIPWKEWMKGEKPLLDPISSILPHDQHALIFPSYSSMLEAMDQANERGTPFLRVSEDRAESARSKEKYSEQLCLPSDELSRILGPKLISSVAITGSDPFIRTGTCFTVIFEARQKQSLLSALALRRMEAHKKNDDSGMVSGKIPQSKTSNYQGLTTKDRSIRSFVSSFDNFVVVTNSIDQLTQIAKVFEQKNKSLKSLEEYHFFRQRYPITPESSEDAFLIITDSTIRRWCGPEWRIGASRRTRAAAAIAELQARKESGAPLNTKEFPELGKVSFINGLVQSTKFGNLAFLKSVNELNIKKITPAEKKAYEFFRDRYQSHWSKYFDPICAQLSIDNGKIKGDLSILPLIGGTDYRQMIQMVGEVKLDSESGDPHPETVLHWVSAIDMNSPRFQQASNFAAIMAPSLGAGAFSWVGESFSFYLDNSLFFKDMQKAFLQEGIKGLEDFSEKNFGRIPLGVNVEVRNPFKLTAFLAGLRAWIEQTSPGMTIWSSHSHKGQGYVKIAPGKGLEDRLIKEGSAPIALYYVPSPKLLTISLSENIIQKAIERNLLQREENSTLPKAKWDGMSTAFHASRPIPSLFDLSMGQNVINGLQRKSWNNLHALNEWRIHLKKKDSLKYHQKVWHTDLLCPGGGEYQWNKKFQTYESTVFGHPANPKSPKDFSLFGKWKAVDFGLSFENDGLRVRANLEK